MDKFEMLAPASPASDSEDSRGSEFDAPEHEALELNWLWLVPTVFAAAASSLIAFYNLSTRKYAEHPDERYEEALDIVFELAALLGTIVAYRGAHSEVLLQVIADGKHEERGCLVGTFIGSSGPFLWIRPWVLCVIKIGGLLSWLYPMTWLWEWKHTQKEYLSLNWLIDDVDPSHKVSIFLAVVGVSSMNVTLLLLQFTVLVLTWCASMDAVNEFIRHIETSRPIYWDRLTLEYSEIDRKFEELWSARQGVAMPWLVVCARAIASFVWGIFAYVYNKDTHVGRAILGLCWDAGGGAFVLVVCLYALSNITTACTSTMATTRSIVTVARQRHAKDATTTDTADDMGYLCFMVGLDHSAMGVELVGILVDVKLVCRVLLTISVQLPVAYGIITATASSLKQHKLDGPVGL